MASNPRQLAQAIERDNSFDVKVAPSIKSPLEDFKQYETAQYTAFDPFKAREHYGISLSDERPLYKDLISAYGKSKGKYASQFNDPEIKKYHDEKMARRNAIYDRLKKIPQEQLGDFERGYGHFSDPFDFEDEYFEPTYDVNKFIDFFDRAPNDWELLEDYLKERGY